MSRRKQSNPKPLKSDTLDKLPVDFRGDPETRKGEEDEWTAEAEAMTTDEPTDNLRKSISEDEKKEENEEVVTPKIRLKANLATDPALLNIPKLESAEYLASLPSALQTALASRAFFVPGEARSETPDLARQQLFICPPCGIRYSSLSTLEAHQTYYCSHRVNKTTTDNEDAKSTTGTEPVSSHSDQEVTETPSKVVRTGKQYTCTHCSYSADKKVSLNRHMRMHTVSPPTTQVTNGDTLSEAQDRYCAECDIRFSSQKTYRAHKMHYCSSRHMMKQSNATPNLPSNSKNTSSCTSGSTPASPVEATCRTPPSPNSSLASAQQPFLALPTNPIIIVPYSLICNASVLPPRLPGTNFPNPDTPCFLLPNGTLQPMTQALNCSSAPPSSEASKTNSKAKEAVSKDLVAPLDLSMRKSPGVNDTHTDLENMNPDIESKTKSPTPEKTTPPSTPILKTRNSPSPKRKLETETSRSCSPRVSRTTPKSNPDLERSQTSPETASNLVTAFGIPPVLHPLLLRPGSLSLLSPELQMKVSSVEMPTIPAAAPQVLVKQGVSKCKECNIVFCKYENYVIHKKHYCSARLQDDDNSKSSASPPHSAVSPSTAGTTSPAGQYQQLICLACGIKFTSMDNLNAHQAYYCLKRNELEVRRCSKCRGIAEPGHQCPPSGNLSGWKCPCCDVVSSTASAAQRHMETHTGVKAYRCTICRYKGNTLRGMRTHIRMHFDKRSPDLQEEKYISYILEDEGTNLMEVNMASTAASATTPLVMDDREVSPASEGRSESLHNCPRCLYSSAYKANVIRHIKLLHEEDILVNGSSEKKAVVEEDEEITIKKEAIEPEVIIASVEEEIKEEEEDVKPKLEKESDILLEAAKPGPKYCKSCDISFNYYQTFIAHKKFYCSSHKGEIAAASANNNNNSRAAETSVL